MTVTGLHEVTCPTCKQPTELLFRPKTQDYILLEHYTHTHIKCASSGNVYDKDLAKAIFKK